MSTVVGAEEWAGGAGLAYGAWARREGAAAAELRAALEHAEALIAAGGGDLADRLARIALPGPEPLAAAPPATGPAAVRAPAPGAVPGSTVPAGFVQAPAQAPARSVCATERDRANRARLRADIDELHGMLRHGPDTQRLERLEGLAARLAELDARRDPVTGRALTVQLFEYDGAAFRGDGIAVVALGDLDTADDIGVLVPGLGTTLGSVGSLTEDAGRLYDAAREAAPERAVATVAWIGYDAPSGLRSPAVIATGGARAGGVELRVDLTDIVAMRGDRDPHLVVFGHSYGSTTSAYAAADGGLRDVLDDLVLLGSPGAGPVETAAEFGLAGSVYVAQDGDDPVTRLGGVSEFGRRFGLHLGLGTDPGTTAFGAIRLPAGSPPGVNPHTSYYGTESPALAAFARVLVGEES